MISDKMYELGSRRSSIRELFEYGKKAALEVGAENVYDFSLGNPSVPAPECVTEAALSILSGNSPVSVHGYTSAQGDPETREAVSADLNRRFGCSISPERIYMTCGAAASLCISMKAVITSENDEILVQAPYFPEYKVIAEGTGARFRAVPPDFCSFSFNFPELEKAVNRNTRIMILNSPNNPSGAVISEEQLERLSSFLKEKSEEYGHTIYIISDEPYREIVYGRETPYIPDFYPDTVICYSYSKSLSLPGERIGYIAVPESVSDGGRMYAAVCGAARTLGYVCAPSLMQKVIALCAGKTADLGVYRKNRDLLYGALTGMGYECVRPDGAFYLFVKAKGGDARAFSEKAKKYNILFVPGDDFGCPGYVRIAYCVKTEMIERSLDAFGKLIRSV